MRWFFYFCLMLFIGSVVAPARAMAAAYSPCVKVKEASLRSSPETKSKELRKAVKYTPLETTGKTKRNWIQVKDFSGQVSWIHRKDISYSKTCVAIKVSKSKMYEGPGKEFASTVVAQKGEGFLDLGDGEDGWLHVENTEGQKFWVDLDHIWRPTSSRLRMSFDKE